MTLTATLITQVRAAIAAKLGAISSIRTVKAYDQDIPLSQMPCATVWFAETSRPDAGQPLGEFGDSEYTATWIIRVYFQATGPTGAVDSQVLFERLVGDLFEVFDADLNLGGLVLEARITGVSPEVVADQENAAFICAATLSTIITA